MLRILRQRRDARIWASPERAVLTLDSFSRTEDDGGRDLLAAARRTQDPDLRLHLERHAHDEIRHGRMFRERAAALREALADRRSVGSRGERSFDLAYARTSNDSDAHGFFTAGLYDELGEVAYVAMLHVAEQRASELFEHHLGLVEERDPETAAIFAAILKDEKYHVAYTGTFLERWQASGRAQEVKAALGSARSSRAMGAWKRLGARSGVHFGQALLWLMYWVVFTPFALIGRGRKEAPGWRLPESPASGAPSAELEGQA